jgi:hypothetical protein
VCTTTQRLDHAGEIEHWSPVRPRTSTLARTTAIGALVTAAALTFSIAQPASAAVRTDTASVADSSTPDAVAPVAHATVSVSLVAMKANAAVSHPVLVDAALLAASLPKPVVPPAPVVRPAAPPAPRTPPRTAPRTPPPAPVVAAGDPRAIAQGMLASFGWGQDQFGCLNALWNRESGWRVNAGNPSGAYGIPQALPGSKMASAGADWATNPATQIRWGFGYIAGRYGSPCGAWAHSQSTGWY